MSNSNESFGHNTALAAQRFALIVQSLHHGKAYDVTLANALAIAELTANKAARIAVVAHSVFWLRDLQDALRACGIEHRFEGERLAPFAEDTKRPLRPGEVTVLVAASEFGSYPNIPGGADAVIVLGAPAESPAHAADRDLDRLVSSLAPSRSFWIGWNGIKDRSAYLREQERLGLLRYDESGSAGGKSEVPTEEAQSADLDSLKMRARRKKKDSNGALTLKEALNQVAREMGMRDWLEVTRRIGGDK